MSDATAVRVPLAIVTSDVINEADARNSVASDTAGALVLFSGIVRNHDGGRDVLRLDYRAHPEAERMLLECCTQVASDTGLQVAAAHRIGPLEIGDVALYVAVAAAHRQEAFEACELLVNRIKASVPIWKRQHYADGVSEWVGL